MELVGRWWNGIWSRWGRRDIWLYRESVWHVHARDGDSDTGRCLRLRYADERTAREMVRRLQAAVGPGEWRDLTEISTTRPETDNRAERRSATETSTPPGTSARRRAGGSASP